jgi:hypothetical protein
MSQSSVLVRLMGGPEISNKMRREPVVLVLVLWPRFDSGSRSLNLAAEPRGLRTVPYRTAASRTTPNHGEFWP